MLSCHALSIYTRFYSPLYLARYLSRIFDLQAINVILFMCVYTRWYVQRDCSVMPIRPLLKKTGLEAGETKRCRIASNLSFLSKLLEEVAQNRLQAFLDGNGLMLCTQSAYWKFHGTETVVAKVRNDLLLAADSISSVSIRLNRCLRHRRPRTTFTTPRASVLFAWYSSVT